MFIECSFVHIRAKTKNKGFFSAHFCQRKSAYFMYICAESAHFFRRGGSIGPIVIFSVVNNELI